MLMTLHTSMAVSPLMAVMLVGEACRYEGELEVGRTARLFCNYDPPSMEEVDLAVLLVMWVNILWKVCFRSVEKVEWILFACHCGLISG